MELGRCSRAICVTGDARTREGGDRPGDNFPDQVIVAVRHIEGAFRTDRHPIGISEAGSTAQAIGGSGLPRQSGNRGNQAQRDDLADGAIIRVRHIKLAGAIHRQALWVGELGRDADPVGTADGGRSGQRAE